MIQSRDRSGQTTLLFGSHAHKHDAESNRSSKTCRAIGILPGPNPLSAAPSLDVPRLESLAELSFPDEDENVSITCMLIPSLNASLQPKVGETKCKSAPLSVLTSESGESMSHAGASYTTGAFEGRALGCREVAEASVDVATSASTIGQGCAPSMDDLSDCKCANWFDELNVGVLECCSRSLQISLYFLRFLIHIR